MAQSGSQTDGLIRRHIRLNSIQPERQQCLDTTVTHPQPVCAFGVVQESQQHFLVIAQQANDRPRPAGGQMAQVVQDLSAVFATVDVIAGEHDRDVRFQHGQNLLQQVQPSVDVTNCVEPMIWLQRGHVASWRCAGQLFYP